MSRVKMLKSAIGIFILYLLSPQNFAQQIPSSTGADLQLTIDAYIHPSQRLVQFSFFNFEPYNIDCDWLWVKAEYQETDERGNKFNIGYRTITLSNITVPSNTLFYQIEGGFEQITNLEEDYHFPRIVDADRTVTARCYQAPTTVPTLDETVVTDPDYGKMYTVSLTNTPTSASPIFGLNVANENSGNISFALNLGESVQVEYRTRSSGPWYSGETFYHHSPYKISGNKQLFRLCYSTVHGTGTCAEQRYPSVRGKIYYRFRRHTQYGVSDWTYMAPVDIYYDS